jgi:hypothetical protein
MRPQYTPASLPLLSEQLARHTTRGPACWVWHGAQLRTGYGTLKVGGRQGRLYRAHVAAWLATGGVIPDGYFICHTCDNRICVRNDDIGTYIANGVEYPRRGHLFCAPRQANVADAVAKGRTTRGERNPQARLTEAQVSDIRRRWADGELIATIAADLGLPVGTVYDAASGRNWRHV